MTTKSKQFINEASNAVDEMLEGLVASNPHVCCSKQHRLVLDERYESIKKDRVTLISGGGSGHEPAHAGYVGDGMITAAVCGDVFSSPSMIQVLTAIRLVAGPPGCLLIVKNYTGDRLHFGLAVQEARAEGFKVDIMFVGEDCAVNAGGVTGRRGLAGTALVHKIAGAAAREGLPLDEVKRIAESVAQNMGTVGVALRSCTLPGQTPSNRIGEGILELGLGIHGEPGIRQGPMTSADNITDQVVNAIFDSSTPVELSKDESVILLVNNLGGTPLMELLVVARRAKNYLETQKGVNVAKVLVGSYMTALDMVGCSLTILKASAAPDCLARIESDVGCTGWPKCVKEYAAQSAPFIDTSAIATKEVASEDNANPQDVLSESDHQQLKAAVQAAAKAIIAAEPDLTKWDTLVGDGDCGSTLKTGATSILEMIDARQQPFAKESDLLYAIAHTLRHSIGGTSGILYDMFFTVIGTVLKQSTNPSAAHRWVSAFAEGVWTIERTGGATEGCRTMLDALHPARRAGEELLAKSGQAMASDVLSAMSVAAEKGGEATRTMSASDAAGRTAYVSRDAATDIPDPGAKAVGIWMRALSETCN